MHSEWSLGKALWAGDDVGFSVTIAQNLGTYSSEEVSSRKDIAGVDEWREKPLLAADSR